MRYYSDLCSHVQKLSLEMFGNGLAEEGSGSGDDEWGPEGSPEAKSRAGVSGRGGAAAASRGHSRGRGQTLEILGRGLTPLTSRRFFVRMCIHTFACNSNSGSADAT